MPGMRVASTDEAGWSVETVELALTGATHRRGGRAVPIGDGAQLLVRRHGFVIAYCAGPEDLGALGVDLSRMAVVDRWLTLGLTAGTPPAGRIALAPLLGP